MSEVLIIGGGFAGLAAGVALAKAGRRVRLLEQKPYLGGRARSFLEPKTGCVVDNGQHLLMGCYHATLRFLDEIGTLDRIALQPHLKVQFLEAGGRLTTVECPGLPAPWHLLVGVLRSNSFGWREKRDVVRLGRALAAGGGSRDGIERLSVEEWLDGLGQSEKLRRNFWDLLCIAAMNEDPRRAAATLFERVLGLALFTSPADSRFGLPRVGLSDCYTEAARAFIEARGGKVEFNRQVKSLLLSGFDGRGGLGAPSGAGVRSPYASGVCGGVALSNGEQVEAPVVVSAVPWFELVRLLPADLLRSDPFFTALLALRPAPIISINLWFDRAITHLDFVGLRGTTIQWLFNKGTIPGSGGQYISLVLSGAHAHIERTKEDLLQVALHDLVELVPAARTARVVHSLIIKERFATFSPSWDVEQMRPPARTPVRGLYLAGDWTATGLPATIEGAVRSGYAAAKEILGTSGALDGP